MVFVADDLAAWLVALLADTGRRRLTAWVLGSDQERALREAATSAVQLTARELRPDDDGRADQLAMVVSEVFSESMTGTSPAGQATLLEALQAGIAGELTVLDDASLTGTGESSAQALEIPAGVLAEKLTGHLLRQIVLRGSRGGPLASLANQLSHDVTPRHGLRLAGMFGVLADEIREVLKRLDSAPLAAMPGT